MTAETSSGSPSGPLYAPRSPVLRALLISFVAGFVVCHEAIAFLWKAIMPSPSLASENETGAGLSHEAVR